MIFNDACVQIVAKGILEPGESLLGQSVTDYKPWWSFGLIRSQSLVLATSARLVLVEFRYHPLRPMDQGLRQVDSYAWPNVQELKVTGMLMKKKLKLHAVGARGPVRMTRNIPDGFLFSPMKNNGAAAKNIATVFEQARNHALPAGGFGSSQPQLPPYAARAASPYPQSRS